MKNFKLDLTIAPKTRTETGEKYYTVMGVTDSEYVFIGQYGKTGSIDITSDLPNFKSGDIVFVDDANYIIEHTNTLSKPKELSLSNSRRGGSMLSGFSSK